MSGIAIPAYPIVGADDGGGIISTMRQQTAVWWGNPTEDGRGGFSYSYPVDVECRWEDVHEKFIDERGVELVSRAIVYVDRDMETGGFLHLGEVLDLDSDGIGSPEEVDEAYQIRKFTNTRKLKKAQFLRAAYL